MKIKTVFCPDNCYSVDRSCDVVIRLDGKQSQSAFMDWWHNTGEPLILDDYDFGEPLLLSREDVFGMCRTRLEYLSREINCPVHVDSVPLGDLRLMVWLWLKELKDEHETLAAPRTDAECDQVVN